MSEGLEGTVRPFENGHYRGHEAEVNGKMQSGLAVWVEFFVDLFEVGDVDVGVDLGGGDVDVAEHFLDAA